jgi:predicted SAM-dependent methyltransferase
MKLHLGCWHRNIPGFVNVDLCDMEHIDHKSSIDDLSMFDDGSVSLVYSSHSFEYFNRKEAIKVLMEWSRVLKSGGVLRMAVPDFDSLIKIYNKSNKNLGSLLGPLYGQMEINTQNGSEILYHKTIYNFDSLQKLLNDNGFKDIEKYDWQDTTHKDYDDHSQAYFPHMDKENGILVSLNDEAVKI